MLRPSVVLALVLTFPSLAAAQVKIAWKLDKGDRFFVEEVTTVRQTIVLMGEETRQDLEQTRLSRWSVLGKDPKGNLVLDWKIENVKLKPTSSGIKADAKLLKQLEGTSLEVTLDSTGKVRRLDGYAELVRKLANDSGSARLVRTLLPEDSFKASAEALFSFVPAKEVTKGDKWQQQLKLPLGPFGSLQAENTCTLENDDKLATVAVTGKATYSPPASNDDSDFKVTGSDVRVEKSGGTLKFDVAAGRLVEAQMQRNLRATFTLMAPGGTLPMELRQEQTVTTRVLDKMPKLK